VYEGEAAAAAADDAGVPGAATGAAAGAGVRDPDGGDPVVARAAGGAVRVPLLRPVLPGLLRQLQVLLLRQAVRHNRPAIAAAVWRVQGMPDVQRRRPVGGVHRHVMSSDRSMHAVE